METDSGITSTNIKKSKKIKRNIAKHTLYNHKYTTKCQHFGKMLAVAEIEVAEKVISEWAPKNIFGPNGLTGIFFEIRKFFLGGGDLVTPNTHTHTHTHTYAINFCGAGMPARPTPRLNESGFLKSS